MTEIEFSKESPKTLPTQKEPTIKKIYNIFLLLQNIFSIIAIISIVVSIIFIVVVPKFQNFSGCSIDNSKNIFIGNTVTILLLINLLISTLLIIIGVLSYLFNRTEKNKKTFIKKFIIRGFIGLAIIFIIYLVISIIPELFAVCTSLIHLPTLFEKVKI